MTDILHNYKPLNIQENIMADGLKNLLLSLFQKKGSDLKKIICGGRHEGILKK